ncbi:MAG: helix-turn-helix domain-containing protein [Erysipelotrichaceae bacterium]|nr:helix-turn-helix domain-containing protein [Erysipelotrichaceae bacterium]
MNHLPGKLMKLRKHYNYSQSYLAEVLDVDTLEYMNYENGSKMISYAQMKKLASLYHVNVEEIFRNDEEVTLYEMEKANTDEINIEYFIARKTIFDTVKDFYLDHKIASTIIMVLLLTIVVLSIVLKNTAKPYTLIRDNINRLSVSESTVVYIDDYSAVNGSGSNTNGELSNLTSSGAIKVQEGEGFTIILNEDGTVSSAGLISKYAKELQDWHNIVDIAAGRAHVLGVDSNGRVHCTGDNSSGACDIEDVKGIKKVYAPSNGSIAMDEDGMLYYSGSFIGSGSLKNYQNIKDVASSDNILAILCQDGTVDVFAKSGNNYLQAESWKEIVDVCCGDSFVAGLDQYGKVHIEIDNDEIISEVEMWSNIIAIDAGSDYLIGFDGVRIYGVGNNSYNQFSKEDLDKQRLEMVSEVEYHIDEEYVSVQFKGVSNASGYLVSIDVGIGISRRLEKEEVVKFETDNMTDGKNYTITIVSIGEGDYTDSDPFKLTFTYEKPEETYSFAQGRNMSEEVFRSYLLGLGVPEDHIHATMGGEDDICAGDSATVSWSNLEGKTFTKSELLNMEIEYTYCRIMENE